MDKDTKEEAEVIDAQQTLLEEERLFTKSFLEEEIAKAKAEILAQEQAKAVLKEIEFTERLAEHLARIAVSKQQLAAPSATSYSSLSVSQAHLKAYAIGSPSKNAGFLLQEGLSVFDMSSKPHMSSLRALSDALTLNRLCEAKSPSSLLSEEAIYDLTTEFVPSWVTARERSASKTKGGLAASTIFGFTNNKHLPVLPTFMKLPWNCQPELLTSAKPFHPAFNGEVKSARSSSESASSGGLKMFDEVVTYVALGMIGSLFHNVPEGCRRFYTCQPVGYGLIAVAYFGHLVSIEWIGRLFVSIVSQPFYLSSEEHKTAIAALPDIDYTDAVRDLRINDIPVRCFP